MILPDEDRELVYKIRASLKTFHWLCPINLIEERDKFYKDHLYNPQLTYPPLPLDKFKIFEEGLESLEVPEAYDTASLIYKRRIEETKLKLNLILSQGSPRLTEISVGLYRLNFDKKTLESAKQDALINSKFTAQEKLGTRETAKEIFKYLLRCGAGDWKVKESERGDFYFQIRPKKKLISISKNLNWDYSDLESILAHEIDGHVIRALNAKKQKKPMFRENFPFYIKTEEGLASYLGDYLPGDGELTRKHHALKYLAGFYALKHSFAETFKFFSENGFPKNLAFQRTLRLKRGFTDTSIPGCFAREAMYYEGMLEVKNYLDGSGDIRKLYAGKVGLEDIDYIPIPENQIIPQRLTKYLN